jgi:hypothetical protein
MTSLKLNANPVKAPAAPALTLMPVRTGLLQRQCACGGTPGPTGECESCRKKKLQRRQANLPAPSSVSESPPIVDEALRSHGQPLDAGTRAYMEPRFGHDFSGVRVHTDLRAAKSAQEVNALAYTVGRDVVFGAGEYAPGTTKGSRLLAHELAHVVQQAGSRAAPAQTAKAISHPSDAAELEAGAAADRVVSGDSVQVVQAPSATLHAALSPEATAGIVAGSIAGAGLIGVGIAALTGAFDSSKYVNCPDDWPAKIDNASRTAEKWITNAVLQVDSVIAGGERPDDDYVVALLRKHFKIAPTQTKELNKLRAGLFAMQSGFASVKFECDAKTTDPKFKRYGEVKGFLGVYQGYGRIHLYSDWYNEEAMQAETIAHEIAHRYAGAGQDIVYLKDDANTYGALPTDRALDNADSYAQFSKQLFNIGSSKTQGESASPNKGGTLNQKALGPVHSSAVPPTVDDVLSSPAPPLDTTTRGWMESRFSRDFADVRVHTDKKAAESAQDMNAAAYTVGRDVVFGTGRYAPDTTAGRELLAHELTHVVQQKDSAKSSQRSLKIGFESGPEQEADRVGKQVARGETLSRSIGNTAGQSLSCQTLQRKPEPGPEEAPKAQPEQPGGVPVPDPTSGLGGNPPPPDCLDFLWAREYARIFRLDTISVIGLGARPAGEKKEETREARRKNREFQGMLAETCLVYADAKHPFRVRFYYVESDPRDLTGQAIQTEDAKRNRELAENLGAGQTPKILVYVERNLEVDENFSNDTKALEKKLNATMEEAGKSGAKKGAKTGLIVGGVLGGLAGIGAGIATGAAVAAGGAGLGAAIGAGIGVGLLAGGVVLGITAGIGALIGHAVGKERGTAELSKERVKQVQTFVALLRTTGEVKGDELTNSDADDLARDAVTLWIDNPAALPLTVKDRRLLIRVMLAGPTLDDDERAIIKLLENSTDAELLQILDPTIDLKERVTIQDLDIDIHGAEWKETKAMLQARLPTLGAPGVQRTKTASEPACEADQAIMIIEARKRAIELVSIAAQRISDHLAKPQEEVLTQIHCFFPGAGQPDIIRIKEIFDRILQLIPSSRYVCPGQIELQVPTPVGAASVDCTSRDVAQTVAWNQGPNWHARKETYLCPTFFAQGPQYQATSLVHEWVHRAIPETGTDTYDPKCGDLKTPTALENPDSYAHLAHYLAEGHARAGAGAGLPTVTIGNFRNNGSVTPENRCLSCPQIPTLGPDPATGANFMELRGDISGHRPDALYDFKRTREVAKWKMVHGNWERDSYDPPGTLDDASAADEDVAPKDDRIYTIDGPGLHAPLPSIGDPDYEAGAYKGNFIETVNVKVGDGPWTQSSNAFAWHSITWFERGKDGLLRRTPSNNEIEPGSIIVDAMPWGMGDFELPKWKDGIPA